MVRNRKVALDIVDPVNPYKMAVIRGRVKETTFDVAEDQIDRTTKKYRGTEKYEMRRPGIRRVLMKIQPAHLVAPREDNPRWQAWRDKQESGGS